ncbi:peptide-methionine (S)-S-oxide reductase MsrA [Pontibacter sp. 172403-2]|uniref:peptide-methionine (S)-S-oxide reductase MsrA n=1 Tax=Pontibacter rufus TaxID=2791028 RepID=UPI0018AFB1A4|nr:peptide-methionine (S)-S-oxide reductase MsrA [Pontibacter sp. 172403-2]MBF9253584.1 peptide-methionine (S)-S-oxide reductase MsrA [Pontibacter sp. 172403-2]
MANRLYSFLLPLLVLLNVSCSEANSNASGSEDDESIQTLANTDTTGLAVATFSGGCFWCTEAFFERLQGVKAVISGYAGGTGKNPTYQQVSAGNTNYAESVQVFYDPAQITYQQLLEVFFATHDPTTIDRQGNDIGHQYRSIVFYKTPEERQVIEDYIKELNESGTFRNKIVTEVKPFDKFWEAEKYHQDYYRRNPDDPYVQAVAIPKVQKFVAHFGNLLKPEYRTE